ncbi:MAG TPA: Hsp20 family protein [Candidatus Elarobacter sp.]
MIGTPEALGFSIERNDQGYRVEMPVAGFRPDEVSITVEDNQLVVEGRNDRRRFTRALVLPDEIDVERIEAKVENGMLNLNLPLSEKAKPRRIQVAVGSQDAQGQRAVTGSGQSGTAQTVTGETQESGSRTAQPVR